MKARALGFTPVLLAAGLIGITSRPALTAAAPATATALAEAQVQAGARVYTQHCAACHGAEGDGNGPATVWLFPKPRNFKSGLYKIQSTPAGALPSDDDLFESITRGLAGSSMPSFAYLSADDRRAVVQYVKHLTAEVGADGKRVNKFEEALKQGPRPEPIAVPPEPPLTFDSITQGKAAYARLQCTACHGENGAGDGPSAPTLRDVFGVPVPPRDFNTGAFRGGATGRDLYLRVAVGIAGTPMPPFGDDVIQPAERWALVHYIQSLRRKDAEVSDILVPEDGTIPVSKASAVVSTDPAAPAWEHIEPVRVPLNPLWPEPDPVPAVAVRAVHDGQRVAILLQWRDELEDGAPVRVQDFQDAVALQFSLTGRTPFLGMGDSENPVNIWQWKAGWQADVNGQRQDVDSTYPSMHSDVYFAWATNALYRTAEAAGNLTARVHASPVEDANARGFGTMKSQPAAGQNVRGKGIWRDGFWSVVLVRELRPEDASDVRFEAGRTVPVSFAIWNGQQRDRNGKKVISNWYHLRLDP